MNVLLVNSDRVFPLDRLDAKGPLEVSVITEHRHAHRYPDAVELGGVDDVYDLTQVRDAALEILRRRPIDAVIAPAERSLPAAGFLRSFLGLPGFGFDTANHFSHKYAMKRRLASAGLPVPRFALASGFAEVPRVAGELGWPVVVKPCYGGGAQNTFVITGEPDYAELADSPRSAGLRQLPWPLVVEGFVDMIDEYHCNGVVYDGEVRFAAVARYDRPLLAEGSAFASHVVPPENPDEAVILDLHARTVRALGLSAGVTHMELYKTPDGFLIGEITCRPGGAEVVPMVELQYGVDLWDAFIDISLGRTPHWEVHRRPGIVLGVPLRPRPGRILALTPADEFRAIPGAIRVELAYGVGDTVNGGIHTSSALGVVYLAVPGEADVESGLRQVAEVYRLRTDADPVDAPATR